MSDATLTRTDGLFKSCPGSRVSHRHMTWVTKPSVAVAHAQWRFNDQSDIILTLTGEQRSIKCVLWYPLGLLEG